ncbi:amidohydrolase/deacetylase family metallohydrolase [uncultured Deefgea sp.]|uniref:amidohydrolase/deacetylase family metallohydrolase n=1 Tax=uncultured Deefgea sp. TaxID=1304914 RepID=UPI002618E1C6|nr:amidohydrolase/deacetylase family metallohydrolase [uncultured Deefgea sp.]
MFDLIIRRARAIDAEDVVFDLAIKDGLIAKIGQINAKARQEIDLNGRFYASAGWIDSHVHCYSASPIYNDEPDLVGIAGGVTTVIDAGSCGANDIGHFNQLAQACQTEVRALLNISRIGLATQHELADLADIDLAAADRAITQYPDFIVGLKARLSSSVVGGNGITPLKMAKAIQQQHPKLPLMVHVGNTPPDLDDITQMLDQGDILTHCYNGKPNRILNCSGTVRTSIYRAIERGVTLDVGHGGASFSFAVARQAIAQGVLPNTISSDIYCRNRIAGPVFGLAPVMAKFLSLGMTLAEVIQCVTAHPAQILHLTAKGRLEVGFAADISIFAVDSTDLVQSDCEGESLLCAQQFRPLAAIVAGKIFLTDEGKTEHVFNL